MAGDDLFKRYLEIGASVLGMSRERAESIVRDLVASGEVARGQATKAADWLVERGRAGTEELAEMVRKEIRQQVTALGLATKDDLAGLEAQIDELKATAPKSAKAAGGTAKAATGSTKAAAASRPPKAGSRTTKSAGISRSASVGKRSRPGSSADPGDAPPAGEAAPPKG
jgi:polyhydroxyalkanoate synthesis regulator phasin